MQSSSSCVWNLITKRNSYISGNLLSSYLQVTASASTSVKPWRPFDGCYYYSVHSMMMWFTVCWSAPQSHAGLLERPHLHISALKCPTPVRSLLSLTQACRGRSDPGLLLDGEVINSHNQLVDGYQSTDHILAIQWAFVSLGRIVDRMCFPLVVKGHQDFSLGCVSSLVAVWWRKWSGSMVRQASARFAARLRSSADGMPASTGSCSTGVGCKHPVIIRRVQFRLTSNKLVCQLLLHVVALL